MPMMRKRSARYLALRHTLFFAQRRVFGLLSALLLDNGLSGRLRLHILRVFGATVGHGAVARGGLNMLEGFGVSIGDGCYIGNDCTFDCSEHITLGRGVVMAYGVTIVTGTHLIDPSTGRPGATAPRPVVIGDGCWIGARALILPGLTIGAGSIIGAGSVVTKDVAPNAIVAGNPASVMRVLEVDRDAYVGPSR